MEKYTELCEELGIVVAGLLDNDYWGNTAELGGVKVLDTEKNIDQYLNNYNFFCATNWNPIDDPIMVRNRQKKTVSNRFGKTKKHTMYKPSRSHC